jgi:alginate production protein
MAFREDLATLEPRLSLALASEPTQRVQAFTELELSRDFIVQDEADLFDAQTRIELEQAYVTFTDIYPGFSLQLGRQLYEDERDWWYKEELDAIRLYFRTERFGVELSVSRNELVGEDLLNRDDTDESNNYVLISRYAYKEDSEFDAYVFKQDDHSDAREDPLFLGVRSIGEIGSDFEHWIDAAVVRGKDDGRDIHAYGFDVGLTYEPALPLYPLFTLGTAFGSGDSDPQDGVDHDFRQTGFQESYYYYGEILAPELSNMWIFTAGASVLPTYSTSVGFLYHYYRQHRAADTLRDALVYQDPDGRHKDLGHALDFIATWDVKNLYVDLILGTFFPGDAFSEDAPNAYFSEFIISYEF